MKKQRLHACFPNFFIKGVPVLVRLKFLWTFPLFLAITRSLWDALLSTACIFAILLTHELGHAAVARFCGLPVSRIDIYFFHGQCIFEAPEYEIEHAAVAWGGVLAQVALLVLGLSAAFAVRWLGPPVNQLLNSAIVALTLSNFIIIAFNLMPLRGLDGALAWKLVPAIANGDFKNYLRARRRANRIY